MTREKAIRELQYIRYHYPSKNIENLEADNALYMAIKALEQEPCEDVVSRQAVINAIANTCFWLSADNWTELMKCICSLPSVISQPKTEWVLCSERYPTREECIANNGLFIVSDGNRTYAEYFDLYDKNYFGEPTMDGFRVDRCVTAWMPLPESYKPERERKEW